MMQKRIGCKLLNQSEVTLHRCSTSYTIKCYIQTQAKYLPWPLLNRHNYSNCLLAPLRQLSVCVCVCMCVWEVCRGLLWLDLPGLLFSQSVVPLHMCKAVGTAKQAGHQEASSARDIHTLPKQICAKSSIQSPAVHKKPPDWKADAAWQLAR